MNVLKISSLYPVPYNPPLGISIHNQVKNFTNKGCEVQVIAPVAWTPFPTKWLSKKWRLFSEVPAYILMDGVEVFHPRYVEFPRNLLKASSGVRMYLGIRGLVKKIQGDFPFDLIHAQMALPDGYAGMLLSQDYNKPLVVTFRSCDVDITAKFNVGSMRALQKVFDRADRVIAPTPRLSEVLSSDFGVTPETIGFGLDPDEVCSIPRYNELRRRYEGRRILLSVSRLIPTKGLDLNLYALKRLIDRHNDLLYLIVGDGALLGSLQQLTHVLGLENYVEFIGHMPHQQVMEYMSNCDIFTLPSWQETLGLVYIEAMAHAKPVIGCRGQGVDGIVSEGESGLLAEPMDVDSLVRALDFLLSNADKAKEIGERARKLVFENYTWEESARKHIELYKELLEHDR